MSRVNLDDLGDWPLCRDHAILSQNYDVSNSDVIGRTMPFVDLLETGEILGRPSLPEMSDQNLAQVPSSKKRDGAIGRRWVWECLQRSPNQEVPRSQWFDAIIITGQEHERPTVEAGLYLS